MSEQPIRILLASHKHVTAGKHSAFMPVAIGFIAAYTRQEVGASNVDFRLVENPNQFMDEIDNWKPEIIGVSNYCWNAEINYLVLRKAKEKLKNIICIAGGPEFDDNEDDCHSFLSSHPEIDFFAYGEGEIPFALLTKKVFEGNTIATLKKEAQTGFMAIDPKTGDLFTGERPVRSKEMDFIPSPYLTGIMDIFFSGEHAPMVQLARGCPYFCTFCNAAQSWYNRVAAFSPERVNAELDYIAEKTKNYPNLPLAITDSNFGMFKRDVDIAHHIRGLQDKYDWPVSFDFTSGKAHHDRILHVNELMRNTAHILLAVQSMNDETLDVIKRKNLSGENFMEINREIKSRGMLSATDLIIPLPEETKESFLEGLKLVTDAGVDLIISNTLCLLKGTELDSLESRKKYKMDTRWRLVPRQYGTYAGEKTFDLEEVCIATNTMSFEDYLECRGIGSVAIIFSDRQFDLIDRHVNELGISKFDLILKIWETLSRGQNELSPLYDTFLEQSKSELFDSFDDAIEFYSRPGNYLKLKSGEIGDNLIRRFRGGVFLTKAIPAINLAYDCLEEMAAGKNTDEEISALRQARKWVLETRDVSNVLGKGKIKHKPDLLHFKYDFQEWYDAGLKGSPLIDFKHPTIYKTRMDTKQIQDILNTGIRLYGNDKHLSVPRILEYHDISSFWVKCSPSEQITV